LRKSGPITYVHNIRRIIKAYGPFIAIHVHTSLFIWLACYAAKKEGINIRIGHAHGSKFQGHSVTVNIIVSSISIMCMFLNRHFCTTMLACAEASGKSTFGKNFKFLPNFVDHKEYIELSFNELQAYKKTFDIPVGEYILGYVGYIGGEKNTKFLVDVFEKLHQYYPTIYLVMAGDGEEFTTIKNSFEQKGLSKYVRMLGHRSDVHKLMQIFDVYLMPSFSEGMSIAILEAQICGIPCVASHGVPLTNDISAGLFYRCESFDSIEWVKKISDVFKNKTKRTKEQSVSSLVRKGYDIDNICERLKKVYLEGQLGT